MAASIQANEDPFLWLEEIEGEKALSWVEQQNHQATDTLTNSDRFIELKTRLEDVLNSDKRIPYITRVGSYYHNFWQDEDHPRGIIRRTTLEQYRQDDTLWETVLDIDALAETEEENWVYAGASILRTTYDRAIIALSRGGSDATVIREFDLVKKEFVNDGFELPEAKTNLSWINKDEIFVSTDLGEGSLTESGYPRIVKRWKRGQPIAEAETVFEGDLTDVLAAGFAVLDKGYHRIGVTQVMDFYSTKEFLFVDGKMIEIPKPLDAEINFFRDWLLLLPKEDWRVGDTVYAGGSLIAVKLDDFLAGAARFDVLFNPTPTRSLVGHMYTKNHVFLNILDNVRSSISYVSFENGEWRNNTLQISDGYQSISVYSENRDENDCFFIESSDFLTPSTFGYACVGQAPEVLRQEPHVFETHGATTKQRWATSRDGTKVPYFEIGLDGQKDPAPTLLYGYGGFEISLLPNYSSISGPSWIERGGIYVIANIRGGGEFGPDWHRAALKANRHRAYEDFIAVAEDLVRRKVTTPSMLGIRGGSNGGLLMGNMLFRRPDLFGAIVANVPLFDMQRYHELLAGASWIAEYGDPDVPEEWQFIQTFSPYHNLSKEVAYPALFVTTSTKDDRVHPGHARKLVARMLDWDKDVTYYENTEGGHGGAANNAQRAYMSALQYEFLYQTLFRSGD